MLVLLHFHALGYTPLDLAFPFGLYEIMSVVTNFIGGWVGARFGLRVTLFAGIALQVLALLKRWEHHACCRPGRWRRR